ncbi:hypothetical protein [Rickettsia endosymbiont of Pantilius tunicatus]|uniref:hypothetical protein n=1 Tax=Rickettsia endosymbiont of Pantilius tunicatus TaxID=3066267 RepID=UPI0030DF3F28
MFRKFILIALLCLNSYKALAEDNKSKYVINNSIYVMESFKNKDSLVKNKKNILRKVSKKSY